MAVVNLTDDAMLFAQGAISSPQFPWVPADVVKGAVLEAACSWRELEVVSIDATPPRSRIEARVVHRGFRREFIGFNRARHAVLEAAILATRTHLLPAGADPGGVRPAPGHRGQDRRPAGAGGDGDPDRVCPIALASSSRRRRGSISACWICGARWDADSEASARRCRSPRCCWRPRSAQRLSAQGPDADRAAAFAERFLATIACPAAPG